MYPSQLFRKSRCFKHHTEYNTLCLQETECLVLKQVLHIVTTVLQRANHVRQKYRCWLMFSKYSICVLAAIRGLFRRWYLWRHTQERESVTHQCKMGFFPRSSASRTEALQTLWVAGTPLGVAPLLCRATASATLSLMMPFHGFVVSFEKRYYLWRY